MEFWNQIHPFLNQKIYGNRLENILWCVGILLFGLLLKRAISLLLGRFLFKLVQKESENVSVRDFLKLLRRPVEMFIALMVVYTAFSFLRFPAEWHLASARQIGLRLILLKSYQLLIIIAITWILMNFLSFFILVLAKRSIRKGSGLNEQFLPFVKEVSKVFLVIFAFFFILGSVFNLDIGSIVAGLGIGGLAVALAAKESLENLFASFTIFLDKPFIAGDVVQVGEIIGSVEKVGFRSTRIRTMDKSYLTLPNKMMVDQALDNRTQRRFRRARFNIGLTYDTSADQIRVICNDIQQAIAEFESTKSEPAQVCFSEFGQSSLLIMILYFVESTDWTEFNRVKEEINYKIIEIVTKHKASFAFPTQTLYVHHENYSESMGIETKINN